MGIPVTPPTDREGLVRLIRDTLAEQSGLKVFVSDAICFLTALEAAGLRVVPVVPTDRMIDRAWDIGFRQGVAGAWHSMLLVSPYAPPGGEG